MKAAVCLLLFVLFTKEGTEFADGHWNTFMVHTEPLFVGNPVNLWDLAVGFIGLMVALRSKSWRERVRPLNGALLRTLAALLLMVAWGGMQGGDLRQAYYQNAGLLRMVLIVPILVGLFRSTRDLTMLLTTIGAAAVYRALACIVAFQWVYMKDPGGIQPWPEAVTDHHDSALWTATLVGLTTWLVLQFSVRKLLAFVVLASTLFFAVYYNMRRLAWMELAGGLALSYITIPRGPLRRRLNRFAMAAAPVLLVYIAVGWGRSGAIFAPVDKIRSMVADDKNDSNRSRDYENAGLVITLQGNRLLGTGFGHEYEEVSTVYSIGMRKVFPNYRYIPHNSVLGLMAFTGLLGFPVIWSLLAIGAFFAARARRMARRFPEQVLSTIAFAFYCIYGLQAYGDMGLFSLKANMLLGCAVAVTARLAVLTGAWPVGRSPGRARRRTAAAGPATASPDPLPATAGARGAPAATARWPGTPASLRS
jgi:hypothetical protein